VRYLVIFRIFWEDPNDELSTTSGDQTKKFLAHMLNHRGKQIEPGPPSPFPKLPNDV
jgi:hypothetical protein